MQKIFFFLVLLTIGCKNQPAVTSRDETTKELKKVFQSYLYKGVGNDSSKAKYYVEDVTYFEDVTFYECEFKVRLVHKNFDTTGIMTARISKDLTKVTRKS